MVEEALHRTPAVPVNTTEVAAVTGNNKINSSFFNSSEKQIKINRVIHLNFLAHLYLYAKDLFYCLLYILLYLNVRIMYCYVLHFCIKKI